MSTGDLGRSKSDQQIGDITLSYNQTTAAGNALLATNGAMLDVKKYPLLAAKLGSKLELLYPEIISNDIPALAPSGGSHFVGSTALAQSDDGAYCYLVVRNKLVRYQKQTDAFTVVVSSAGENGGAVRCSSSGQYVVFVGGAYGSSNKPVRVFVSRDYGASFTTVHTHNRPYNKFFCGNEVFISRNGKCIFSLFNDRNSQDMVYFASTDYGTTWVEYCDQSNSRWLQSVREDLSQIVTRTSNRVEVSTNLGQTWSRASLPRPYVPASYSVDPHNNDLIVSARTNSAPLFIEVSKNGGTDWQRVELAGSGSINRLFVYNSVITVEVRHDSIYTLYVSHDLGRTWHKNELFKSHRTDIGLNLVEGATSYFHQDNKLYSSKIEEITRLPLGNLNSERIIADKVV